MAPSVDWIVQRVEAAGQAAMAALPAMESEIKPDATSVTNIDRMVEARLRAEISAQFPSHGFVGEEYGTADVEAEFLWAIDPVDGTANLVHGLPLWGISVGLLQAGQAIAGVVHLPVLKETYAATTAGEATWNGRTIRATDLETLSREDTVGIGSEAIHLVDLTRFVSRQRNLGAVALHLVYTARGSLRGNVSWGDKLWDIAAGLLIAREAGCHAEWLSGGEVALSSWLDGTQRDEPMLVAPPQILRALRSTFVQSA
jgi:myo-inositol-1(or 4)-monophosphatase